MLSCLMFINDLTIWNLSQPDGFASMIEKKIYLKINNKGEKTTQVMRTDALHFHYFFLIIS